MASFNRVILAGNLTRDPQLSYLPSNTPVCEFGLAVNRRTRDKEGNQREEVCYVDLQAFGRTAEMINQYFQKGRAILIEGRLRYRDWTNKEGQKRNKLDVVVENFAFIDSGQGRGPGQGGPAAPRGRGMDDSAGPPPVDDVPPPSDSDIPF
jgi:single-strand DNA-binding protein